MYTFEETLPFSFHLGAGPICQLVELLTVGHLDRKNILDKGVKSRKVGGSVAEW